jgi:CrcB protein
MMKENMSFSGCALLAAGGALGTMARYCVSMMTLSISKNLPWGTILINAAGSFIIGFFGTLTLAHGRYPLSENARLFVMIGFCGGFTTFSSFSLQTFDLFRTGALGRALANIFLSVALCFCAVAAGHFLASHFNGGAVKVAQAAIEEEA